MQQLKSAATFDALRASILLQSEYGFRDFRFPELRFPHTGISNVLAEAARDSLMEELEEILAGGLGGTNLFFSAW